MRIFHSKVVLVCFSCIIIFMCIHKISKLKVNTLKEQLTLKVKIDSKKRKETNRFSSAFNQEYLPLNMTLFRNILKTKSDGNRTIIISLVDVSFVDMAINFYETSFKKHNIQNYIFLCAHQKATEKLLSQSINAISAWNDDHGETPSCYGSAHFYKKNIYKTVAATLALKMGYNVVVMDIDIILFRNPFLHLTCNDCDMIFSTEGNTKILNAGLYVGISTKETIKMHEKVVQLVINSHFLDNEQDTFNKLLRLSKTIKLKKLDHSLFQNGRSYFELGKRMFAGDNPCTTCISVHNNYIKSHSHKVYRFKEHLLWTYDEDNYYSSNDEKYILYENKFYLGERETMLAEEMALQNAFLLGYLLNRTVILPRFFCYLCAKEIIYNNKEVPLCAANIHFNIDAMVAKLKNKFKESTFLSHPKVSNFLKHSVSEVLLFNTKFYIEKLDKEKFGNLTTVKNVFLLKSSEDYFPLDGIIKYVKPFQKYHVLKFHSLYGNLMGNDEFTFFKNEIIAGIKSLHTPNFKIVKFLNGVNCFPAN